MLNWLSFNYYYYRKYCNQHTVHNRLPCAPRPKYSSYAFWSTYPSLKPPPDRQPIHRRPTFFVVFESTRCKKIIILNKLKKNFYSDLKNRPPNAEQTFLSILLANITLQHIDQRQRFSLTSKELQHRQTRSHIVARLLGQGQQRRNIRPEMLSSGNLHES